MHLAFELSGEHPPLARAEAQAVLETFDGVVEHSLGRVVTGHVEAPVDTVAQRVALAWRLVEVAGVCKREVERIVELAPKVELEGRSFAVRCSRLLPGLPAEVATRIERELGRALSEQAPVDLEAPEVVVRVLLDERAVVGVERAVVDRSAYEARHPEHRPHFQPVSLHPRLARTLVNLTRVEPGQRLWDPFVGTGGLLLEAALVGAEAVGSDLDPAMVEGTRSTLEAFEQEARLVEGDVEAVARELGPVEAIVTDPPYGRASSTHREEVRDLYARFFRAAASVLVPGGRLVCVFPRPDDVDLAGPELERVAEFDWYVHGTLTRHVQVLEKRG